MAERTFIQDIYYAPTSNTFQAASISTNSLRNQLLTQEHHNSVATAKKKNEQTTQRKETTKMSSTKTFSELSVWHSRKMGVR